MLDRRIRSSMMLALIGLLGCGSAPGDYETEGEAMTDSGLEAQQETEPERASGTFDVELAPAPTAEGADPFFGRMTLDKQFHGDLAGTGEGLMLAVRTEFEGSAGYVAMEKFTGVLDGREGSFVLQHSGILDRGAEGHHLVVIVPDSGTGELEGIAGAMTIDVVDEEHRYELSYELPG